MKNIHFGLRPFFSSLGHVIDPKTHSYCVKHTNNSHTHGRKSCSWPLSTRKFCLGLQAFVFFLQPCYKTTFNTCCEKTLNGAHILPKRKRSIQMDRCGCSSPNSWSLSSRIFMLGLNSFFSSLGHGLGPKTYIYYEKHNIGTKYPPQKTYIPYIGIMWLLKYYYMKLDPKNIQRATHHLMFLPQPCSRM